MASIHTLKNAGKIVILSTTILMIFSVRLAAGDVGELNFERDIRPIFKAHCLQCHGEGEKLKGGVDLRLRRFMLRQSDQGTVLVPGNVSNSVLARVLQDGSMPKSEKKLPPEAVKKVIKWIESGAATARPEPENPPAFLITEEERLHWAFQPVKRPTLPDVKNRGRAQSAIDLFLLEKLEQKHLGLAEEAARETLLRRIYIDLTGLPPSPEDSARFLNDTSPTAYARLVDHLLNSPQFGERWAVHWLDVAGYADSNGGPESDSDRAFAWKFRDYVIRSLNADKRFDQFITEQIAGDEMIKPPYEHLNGEGMDKLVATGFLRMAPDPTGDNPPDSALARNQVIADTIQIVSSSLLGLTVQCAQCHDHRYDPIPQSDYYRLRAVFEPAFDWNNWKSPGARNISLLKHEVRKSAEALENEAAAIDKEAQKLHDELIEAFVQLQLKMVPEELKAPVLAARRTAADKRNEGQKELLRQFPVFQDGIILGEIDKEGAKRVEEVRKKSADIRSRKPTEDQALALVEEPGRHPETFRFHRGDHQQPKERVGPGGLSVLDGIMKVDIAPTNRLLQTTGRRLAFAEQLTSGEHPLVPRVLVNRIWHHLFGSGIVPTLSDFGTLGERPSHPELLDWLAAEFMAQGWRLKPLVREIVLSSAYRQSHHNNAAQEADPDNRLFGRRSIRRLDAETLRDALLAVSGRNHSGMYGKPVPVAYSPQGQVVVGSQNRDGNGDPTNVASIGGEEFRRSIYVTKKRTSPVGIMETFDFASPNPNCEIRASSTVALQSLLLMNDPFVQARAADLAERVERERPGVIAEQIRRAWHHIYAVPPSDQEYQRSLRFYQSQVELISSRLAEKQHNEQKPGTAAARVPSVSTTTASPENLAMASLCHALFSANRFLYSD